MNIRKEIDNSCSLAIEGLDLSCSNFVCNSIIENTNSSISSTIVTPPLLNNIENHGSPASFNYDAGHKAETALPRLDEPIVHDYKKLSALIVPDKPHYVVDQSNDSVSSSISLPCYQAYSDSASSRPLLIPTA